MHRKEIAIIGHFLGGILLVMAACMAVPMLVEAQYHNADNVRAFFICMLGTLFVGGLLYFSNRQPVAYISVHQCFLLLTLCWLSAGVAGAMPLYLTDARLDLTEAVFEGIAGITTTSATVMEDLQGHSRGVLLWRSMLQMIGGAGAIILGVIFLPMMHIGGMQHFRTGSPDISAKTLPRARSQVQGIIIIYIVLNLAGFLAYHGAGMSWFDALNHAMTSISTGGFSTYDASLGAYTTPAIHWIAALLMILGACPFVLYLRAVARNSPQLFTDTQVRTFITLVLAFTALLTVWLCLTRDAGIAEALRLSALTITSTLTTTGYVIDNSLYWGGFSAMLILFLGYLGGCAGATAGGLKMMRVQILAIHGTMQLKQLIHPHGAFTAKYKGNPLPHKIMLAVLVFTSIYVMTNTVLTMLLCLTGLEFQQALSASASAVANLGPVIGTDNPAAFYTNLPASAELLLSLGMVAGRLEIVTLLMVFHPAYWRD